jgi:hypothetical protein
MHSITGVLSIKQFGVGMLTSAEACPPDIYGVFKECRNNLDIDITVQIPPSE